MQRGLQDYGALVARRPGPVLAEHLKDTQYCGVPGNSILDAAATIRDTIAYAETEKVPRVCCSSTLKTRLITLHISTSSRP